MGFVPQRGGIATPAVASRYVVYRFLAEQRGVVMLGGHRVILPEIGSTELR
jgi:hypothetical protein